MTSKSYQKRCLSKPTWGVTESCEVEEASTVSGGLTPRSMAANGSPSDDEILRTPSFVHRCMVQEDSKTEENQVLPLIVKNTFLALDRAAGAPSLRRNQSAPPGTRYLSESRSDCQDWRHLGMTRRLEETSELQVPCSAAPACRRGGASISAVVSNGMQSSLWPVEGVDVRFGSHEVARHPAVHMPRQYLSESPCSLVHSPHNGFAQFGIQEAWLGFNGHPMAVSAMSSTTTSGLSAENVSTIQAAFTAQVPHLFRPQGVERFTCPTTGACSIRWTVDARKLRGNDRSAVSPPFELRDPGSRSCWPFKMVINPKITNSGRSGASFRVAKGQGMIQLKCEASRSQLASMPLTFWLSAGSGRNFGPLQCPRGPVEHDFAQSGVQGLSKDADVWDFSSLVDETTQTFIICLTIQGSLH